MTPLSPDREKEIRADYAPGVLAHSSDVRDLLAALDGVRADHAHVREALVASTELLTRSLYAGPFRSPLEVAIDDQIVENQRVLGLATPEAKKT